MGNKSFNLFLGFIFVALLAGCVKHFDVRKPSAPIKKVAVVSFVVSNWHSSMSWNTAGYMSGAKELIGNTFEDLLETTETKLSGIMKVSRVSGFVSDQKYQSLGVKDVNDEIDNISSPKISGQTMAVFTKKNKELVAGYIEPEVARKLCAMLNVDAVVLVYSEWLVERGHFVPTKKPFAKNVITVWDRNGNAVFSKRIDLMGENTIGGGGYQAINAGTIKDWAGLYKTALDQILVEMKNLTI